MLVAKPGTAADYPAVAQSLLYPGRLRRVARRARATARAVADRVAQWTYSLPSSRLGAAPPDAIPVVVRDTRGAAFELDSREEVDLFNRHGWDFEAAAVELACAALRRRDVAPHVCADHRRLHRADGADG
jgi:hypothetical protein